MTNQATRLEVSQGHHTCTIPYVRYGFLLVCYSNSAPKTRVFQIFDFKNAITLKTGLRVCEGHWFENVTIR